MATITITTRRPRGATPRTMLVVGTDEADAIAFMSEDRHLALPDALWPEHEQMAVTMAGADEPLTGRGFDAVIVTRANASTASDRVEGGGWLWVER